MAQLPIRWHSCQSVGTAANQMAQLPISWPRQGQCSLFSDSIVTGDRVMRANFSNMSVADSNTVHAPVA